ncbi:T9SS type A sorting domain-containing protein [Flavobacterium sp. U410]
MKKIILLILTVFTATVTNAQSYELPVFETGTNEDVSDWTFYLDPACNYPNNNNWEVHQAQGRNYNVLTTRTVEDLNLGNPGNITKIDWAVLPVQDLSYYQNVRLKFTYMKGANAVEDPITVKIYAMNIPDDNLSYLYSSTPIQTVTIGEDGGWAIDPPVAVEESINISDAIIGTHTYIGIVYYSEGLNEYEFYNLDLTKVALEVEIATMSIEDQTTNQAIYVKQNPVAETLQLQFPTDLEEADTYLQIYTIYGTLVTKAVYNNGIDVSHLSSGIYIATVSNGTRTQTLKFIKE